MSGLKVYDRGRGRLAVMLDGEVLLRADPSIGPGGYVEPASITGTALTALLRRLGHEVEHHVVQTLPVTHISCGIGEDKAEGEG